MSNGLGTITIVGCEEGDWEGAYQDGVLLAGAEGHRLRVDQVLEALGYTVEFIETSNDWMESNSNPMPNLLTEVPRGETNRS